MSACDAAAFPTTSALAAAAPTSAPALAAAVRHAAEQAQQQLAAPPRSAHPSGRKQNRLSQMTAATIASVLQAGKADDLGSSGCVAFVGRVPVLFERKIPCTFSFQGTACR